MTMRMYIQGIADKVLAGGVVESDEALKLTEVTGSDRYLLFAEASRIREHFVGNTVHLCSIINAKSGRCAEDCAFCAQSAHHTTNTPVYPLVQEDQMVEAVRAAEASGSACFGIITSGTSVDPGELDRVLNALRRIRKETGIHP